ncbi:NAD(P)H-binding protein [Streptomyces hygroscopicus]|uniref:NAD(P)H-binding protein n=1 Tax=Streptomyces hygroscopicus TaxID=1912 RepID=UPI000AD53447|nr:NAD(P)H-binding protein [Streptomyces hygroscopicus]GLV77332.1 hypothetical protein Shyhy02_53320 [Streptomyces hygroscopicus subsp. hygroscopicus]
MTARVLLAGATGVIGRALVPLLRARGHQVTALVREPSRAAGVELDDIVVADALDAGAVRAAGSRRPRPPERNGSWRRASPSPRRRAAGRSSPRTRRSTSTHRTPAGR